MRSGAHIIDVNFLSAYFETSLHVVLIASAILQLCTTAIAYFLVAAYVNQTLAW